MITAAEYQHRKITGQCVRRGCPFPQSDTCLLCTGHAEAQSRYKKKYFASEKGHAVVIKAQRKWRRTMKRLARCQCCSSKRLKTETYCAKCHAKELVRHRKARRPPSPLRRCGRCRASGHDLRTCPVPAPLDRELPALPPLRIEDFAMARTEAV